MIIQKTPTKIDKIVSLRIGQHQENAATQIKMDVSDWITVHPTAGFHILFKRPGEVQAQPVLSSLEEGILTWTVQAWETSLIGVGYAEVRAIEAESALIAKSRVIPCSVEESIAEDGDVPPEYSGWVERVLEVADLADDLEQSIADGIEDIQAEGATQVGNVNTAGSTQVNAVQAKGEEVRNSIPSDYSTLSGDVTDLKSALTNVDNKKIPFPDLPESKYGTYGQSLRTLGNGKTQWVDQGLPTDEQTASAIAKWLNDHPEATTTVQDRSLTEAKFSNALKLKTIKDYVTPEMFGAVGDGTTDDTVAIQTAIDGSVGKVLVFLPTTYLITEPLKIKESGHIIVGCGSDNTVIKKLNETGDSGSVTYNGHTYDYSEGSIFLVNTGSSNTRFSRIKISGMTINGNGKNNGIFMPFVTYSIFEDLKIVNTICGITNSGWSNSFKDIQITNAKSQSMIILDNNVFYCENIQSNNGALTIARSNGDLESCAFDNGYPSFVFIDSQIVMNNGYCETYNFPLRITNSNVVINGGYFEKHVSTGILPTSECLTANEGSKVTLNSPKFMFLNYIDGSTDNITALDFYANGGSVIKGQAAVAKKVMQTEQSIQMNLQARTNGYIEVNDEIVSANQYIKNKKIVKSKADNTVTFIIGYRQPRCVHIDVVVQAYEKQAHVYGDLFITYATGSTATVTKNNVVVNSNSESEVPYIDVTITGDTVTVAITSANFGNIQTMYGAIEY